MPSSSVAMAVASRRPIQMGRFSLLSGSRRITIGVLVTGSRVRPPTVIKMKFSRFMRPAPRRPQAFCRREPGPSMPDANSDGDQVVDDAIKLAEVPALLDHGAVRRVAIHLAVAEPPRHPVLGVQPDDLLRALLNVLQHPLVRQVVVVASVAEDDHGGALVTRGEMLAVEALEGAPEVGMRV